MSYDNALFETIRVIIEVIFTNTDNLLDIKI